MEDDPRSASPVSDERVIGAPARTPWIVPLAVLLIVLGVPSPTAFDVRIPPTPLRSSECVAGRCSVDVPTFAQLAPLRLALGDGYVIGGTELRDADDGPRELSTVASDGTNVVTVRAARLDPGHQAWVQPWVRGVRDDEVARDGVHNLVRRGTFTANRDHGHWVFEINAVSVGGSPAMIAAVRALAIDESWIG